MTTLRDAAAQVLNTLEQLNSSLQLLDCYKAFDAEITVLEAALEQHDEDVAFMTDRYDKWRKQKKLAEANAALEQPQDPTPPHTCTPKALLLANWCDSFNTVQHDKTAAELRRLHAMTERRLTDEVIAELWYKNGTYYHHFARAIERWLRGQE